jgi:hypothetical protein
MHIIAGARLEIGVSGDRAGSILWAGDFMRSRNRFLLGISHHCVFSQYNAVYIIVGPLLVLTMRTGPSRVTGNLAT